ELSRAAEGGGERIARDAGDSDSRSEQDDRVGRAEQPEAGRARSGGLREDGERVRGRTSRDCEQPRVDEELRHRAQPHEEPEGAARHVAQPDSAPQRPGSRETVRRSQRPRASAYRGAEKGGRQAVWQGLSLTRRHGIKNLELGIWNSCRAATLLGTVTVVIANS